MTQAGIPAKAPGGAKYPVVCQMWVESERGWGQRPDGRSLHMSDADRKEFIADYWARMPDRVNGEAPESYSMPDGQPTIIDVDMATYARVSTSRNGIRLRR